MKIDRIPAILGGEPLTEKALHIVRPVFPDLALFADRFSDALKKGMVTNNSPFVREFEEKLSEYMKVDAITCCNGHSALLLMLLAGDVSGGEVIVPSFTFCATPHAVKLCGSEPVFADIDPSGSLCMDPKDVENKITDKTKAVIGVDVYGIACNYAEFEKIGKKYGIKIFFDSAPAFGSKVNSKVVGGAGDAQSFSFHATKAFATMEGGCVSSRHKDMIQRMAAIRNFGQITGGNCQEIGINAKMQEVCALIGLEAIKDFDSVIEHRCNIASCFYEGLSEVEGLSFAHVPRGQEPAWLYFPVMIDPDIAGINRDLVVEALAAENLFVRKYFDMPCHKMDVYNKGEVLPVTEKVSANVIALPVYNDMTEEESRLFIDAMRSIIQNAESIKEKFGGK